MSEKPKCRVAFRIQCDNLDPIEITEFLSIEPTESHKKGDPNTRVSKKGKLIIYSAYSSGLWCIDSKEPETTSLEEHIIGLLTVLEPLRANLLELSESGHKMDFYCGFFCKDCVQPGMEITSGTIKRIGDLNINFGVSFYF